MKVQFKGTGKLNNWGKKQNQSEAAGLLTENTRQSGIVGKGHRV